MFTVEIHYFRTALVLNYLKEINNYANGTIMLWDQNPNYRMPTLSVLFVGRIVVF